MNPPERSFAEAPQGRLWSALRDSMVLQKSVPPTGKATVTSVFQDLPKVGRELSNELNMRPTLDRKLINTKTKGSTDDVQAPGD